MSFKFWRALVYVIFRKAISNLLSAVYCSFTRFVTQKPNTTNAIKSKEFAICIIMYELLSQRVLSVTDSLATRMTVKSSTRIKINKATCLRILYSLSQNLRLTSSLLDI